VAAVLTKG